MEILIDTNTLIYAAKDKVDLFSLIKNQFPHAEIIIPEEVILEIKRVKANAKKLKERKAASLILQIMKNIPIKKIVMGQGNVDNLLAKEALMRKAAVLTYDKLLKQKLKKAGIRTIFLKQKKILEAD